jgi:hypothetical protein
MKQLIFLTCLTPFIACPLWADPPKVVDITAQQNAGSWRFSVTLEHADTGWEDYADGWRVETLSGEVLATRVLGHPHVNEQPFTRSQSGVVIPQGQARVQIRARDLIGGWSDHAVPFDLP